MADPLLGMAFQAERLALIREIARNLVGDSPPPSAPDSAGPADAVIRPSIDTADETLLADRLEARGRALPGVANLLAGLREPIATSALADDYRQALAQAAKTDLATMLKGTLVPSWPVATGSGSLGAAVMHEMSPAAGGPIQSEEPPGAEADGRMDQPARQGRDPERVARTVGEPAMLARTLGATATGGVTSSSESRASDTLASKELPDLGVLGSVSPAASDALASTEAVVEQALLSLGLADGAANPAAMRGEVGGIIASFVLNAHFQPGWPPLRPIQDPEAKVFVAQLARDAKLSKDDIALLTYLANFGLNRTQLSRIVKLVASATNRFKLLQSFAQVLANIGTLLGAVQAEIEALAEEIKEARAGSTKRERLTLR